MRTTNRGFSLTEILIAIGIISILSYVAVVGFAERRDATLVRGAIEQIQFHLEQARADALAGKNNEPQGVKFNSDSYVIFGGSSYDSGDSSNITHSLDTALEISTTLGGDETIIFSRLTGETGGTATVTVAISEDLTVFRQLEVGTRGDINLADN